MNRKNIYFWFIIFLMILNISIVNADGVISGTGGSSGGTTTGGGGSGTHLQNYGYAIHFCSVSSDSCDTYIYKVYSFYGTKGWETPSGLVGWITATQNGKKYTVETDPTKLYKYLNIPYTGYNGDYQALKNIISDKEIELTTGDYILIEPFTQIDGKLYTFRGIVSTSTKVGQYPFHENYKAAAMTLANAAKVGNDIEAGGNTYTAPNATCNQSKYGRSSEKKFCGYNNNKYIGYGITVVRYDQMYEEEEVEEYYLDLNGYLDGVSAGHIKGYGTADIYINGELVADNYEDYWVKWPVGTTYEIKNITARPNKQYNGVYSGALSGTINSNTSVVLNFSSINSCENNFKSKLDGGLTVEERFDLFENWQYRNLLNFSYDTEEEADEACTTFEHSPRPTSGCISGVLETNFSSNNLSSYDEIIDLNGAPAFCGLTFNINNNIGTSTFPKTKAGMLILKRDENNKTIATGTITKTCYTLYNGNKNIFETNSYTDYISDESLTLSTNSKNQIEEIPSDNVVSAGPSIENSGLNRYEITYSAKYNLIPWYAKLGSGEILNEGCSNCRFLGYGIYSKLNNNQSSGTINFSYKYDDTTYNGNCTYSVENEIIDPNLNIEFRTFQNNNAFPGKDGDGRIVGSNWCYGDNCNSTNALIANIMNNRNDSYNKMNSEPLYRIVLTPTLIKSIREYNKTNPYDDYTLECDANNKCKSKFLEEYGFTRTTEEIEWLSNYEEI